MKALTSVPKDRDSAYADVLKRIDEGKAKGDKEIAMLTFSWLLRAQRTLTMNELLQAIAVDYGANDSEFDSMYTANDIIECCQSLVVYDEVSKSIRFTHFTVQEFFAKHLQIELPSPKHLALACLTYLTFDVFNHPCNSALSMSERVATYEFGNYAAQFWGYHVEQVEDDPEVQIAVGTFLTSINKVRSMLQLQAYGTSYWAVSFVEGQTLLHLCARNGLATACKLILHKPSKDSELSGTEMCV